MTASAEHIFVRMKSLGRKKIKKVLVGYTYWCTNEYAESQKIHQKELNRFEYFWFLKKNQSVWEDIKSRLSWILHFQIHHLVIPKWSDFIQFNYSEFSIWKKQNEQLGVVPHHAFAFQLEFNRKNLPYLNYIAQSTDFQFAQETRKTYVKQCEQMNMARYEFKKMVESLSKIAEKIFIFIPPVSSHYYKEHSYCFFQNAKRLLSEVSSTYKNVFVMAKEYEYYGLEAGDFLRPGDHEGGVNRETMKFDRNHTHIVGSRKITKALVKWIKEEKNALY
jgi:hypothetical protein